MQICVFKRFPVTPIEVLNEMAKKSRKLEILI